MSSGRANADGSKGCGHSAGASGSGASDAVPGPAGTAILQIHPSLRCNLACQHCYSSSGPAAAVELEPALVERAIDDAALLGYRVVSFSGGEPLLWRGLDAALGRAKELGLRTTVTTNGFFARQGRLARIADRIDVLAVSVDGPRALHDEIRGNARAFDRLESGLDEVRASGIPFGFIHTLTRRSGEHLDWLGDFAATRGARLLQIHPLEKAGRAAEVLAGEAPDDELLAKTWIGAFALQLRYEDILKVQLDLLYKEDLRESPALVYADPDWGQATSDSGNDSGDWGQATKDPGRAADELGLLVLEAGGAVVPAAYGMAPRYRITDVRERSLADAWADYREQGLADFRALCRQVWEELTAPDAPLLANWHETVVAASYRTNCQRTNCQGTTSQRTTSSKGLLARAG